MADSYHFIGIGGIGMSGLARLLLSQKIPVTGSDIAFNTIIESLIREGAVIHKGQAAENVPSGSKVIYTSDVKSDNPEYLAAVKMQCPLQHRSDLLAELLEGKRSLAVAGTHGKTTTSSLLATVLVDADCDPSFAIGGMLPTYQSNALFGKGDLFVFEADESDQSFLKYHPVGSIITNIDNDHLNNYESSIALLIEAFKKFMSQVQSTEHLFWCRDDFYLAQLNVPGQCYGFHSASDWKIVSIRQEGFIMSFDLEHHGHLYKQIELALVGRHNVLNAAAVFGLSRTLGIPEASIRQTFKTFKGILRRCENKGTYNGVLFLDDYAHHPTEIQTTLHGIRQAIGPKRLIAVFQPHRYSRTQDCLGQYGSIFESADEVLLTDIYGAGETAIPGLSHTLIQEEIQQNSTIPCRYVPRSALSHYLSQFVQPYDVVMTLGAGDITKLGSEALSLLEKQQPRQLKVGWIWDSQAVEHFKDKLQLVSSPYLNFCQFGMTNDGHWVVGKNITECIEKKQDEAQRNDRFPASMIQELLDCDVVVPILPAHQETAIQGFLEILGKPYVRSGQRTSLLDEEFDFLQLILFALQEKRRKDRQHHSNLNH